MATMAQADALVRRAVRTGINTMFLSPPARGKTYVIETTSHDLIAKAEMDMYEHFDAGTLRPTDTTMSMPDMHNLIIQTVRDGRLPNYYDTPELRGVIYVGEWMLMGIETSKGFQKLLNHENLGATAGKRFRIPPGVVFLADGNRIQDKSGGQVQSLAIMSRFIQYDLAFDLDYAIEAAKNGYHEIVSTYLTRNPQYIDNYDEVLGNKDRQANDLTLIEGKRGAWANLRTWDKVSRLLRDEDQYGVRVGMDEVGACIGSSEAERFETFRGVMASLASIEQIVSDPKKARVPERMDERFHIAHLLAFVVKNDTFVPINKYLLRFPDELQTCFVRLMNERLRKNKNDPTTSKIRTTDEYKDWVTAPHIVAVIADATS